jgi:acyl carrier protein
VVKFSQDEAMSCVQYVLAQVLLDNGRASKEITWESSLIDDLGLDSLDFVDLTLELESAFCMEEFPMQQWVDAEKVKKQNRFTVASLAKACLKVTCELAR